MDSAVKDAMVQQGKLLTAHEVLKMWPISREYLSRITNHPSEDHRLPSYAFGRRRMYAYEELMWYRDRHRFTPRKRRGHK